MKSAMGYKCVRGKDAEEGAFGSTVEGGREGECAEQEFDEGFGANVCAMSPCCGGHRGFWAGLWPWGGAEKGRVGC